MNKSLLQPLSLSFLQMIAPVKKLLQTALLFFVLLSFFNNNTTAQTAVIQGTSAPSNSVSTIAGIAASNGSQFSLQFLMRFEHQDFEIHYYQIPSTAQTFPCQ